MVEALHRHEHKTEKKGFKKIFSEGLLQVNPVLGKTMQNVTNFRDIQLVTNDKKKKWQSLTTVQKTILRKTASIRNKTNVSASVGSIHRQDSYVQILL